MANTVDKVIDIALAEVGYLEKKSDSQLYSKTANAGYGNYTKYGKEMHELYPSVMDYPAAYCDCFTDWCFYKAYGVCNAKGLLGGDFNDYTVASAQLYKNKKAWYTSNPKIGDQIFFKNDVRICHTGLVYKVDNKYVYTVEGNTSGASGVIANGGGVCKKKYALNYSKIAGYGRPKYDVVETKSTLYKTTSDLNLRSSASSANSNNILVVLPKNTYVSIVKDGTKWVQVQTVINNKAFTGYVSKQYLTNVDVTKNERRKITVNGLNARSGQDVSCPVVFVLKKNDEFTVIQTEKWGLILFNGKLAYANVSNTYSKKI